MDQVYCTVKEVINDMSLFGDPNGNLLDAYIRPASQWIAENIGYFIPITETRTYDGTGDDQLYPEPLLSVTSLSLDGTALSDGTSSGNYKLYPLSRCWRDGPYTRIKRIDKNWSVDDANVSVVGAWGLYSKSKSLGITGTQAAADTATIEVSNGSLLSPGMVILIEDEQELVTGLGNPTAATSLVNGAIAVSDDDITVDDGSEFNVGEVILIGTEKMFIRVISTNDLYVIRGWDQTERTTHANDSAISVYRTFNTERGSNGTTAAIHSDKAISRMMVPYDVNYLARQMAGLMYKKAQSGFAGKVGNAEMGEVFYHQEFPNDVLKRVKQNYRIVSI